MCCMKTMWSFRYCMNIIKAESTSSAGGHIILCFGDPYYPKLKTICNAVQMSNVYPVFSVNRNRATAVNGLVLGRVLIKKYKTV